MNNLNIAYKKRLWATALFVAAVASGCGGGGQGRDPILGTSANAVLPPTVTAVAPVNGATSVPLNLRAVSANFSEPIVSNNATARFAITCASPCVNPTGTLVFDGTNRIGTYTFAAGTTLSPLTRYTVTITGATSIATGVSLAAPFTWQFTTGATTDATRPRVVSTVPATTTPGPTTGVPTNVAISALFTEEVVPATITAASFVVTCPVPCAAPAGLLVYTVGTRTVVFTPTTSLAAGTIYTVTITTAVTDLAGNALAGNQLALPGASDYIWSFTTTGPTAPAAISVSSTNPVSGSSNACPDSTINATFSVPSGSRIDPQTVTSATFTLKGPAPASTTVTAASVTVDSASGRIVTFTPTNPLTSGVTYTATIKGGATGVRDLSVPGNVLTNDLVWSFTVGTCAPPVAGGPAIPLGSAASFGIMATSATTSTGPTQINGNVALSPGTSQGIPPPQVNGVIHVNDAIAAQAKADLLIAYNFAKALPPGIGPFSLGAGTDLSGLTLPPGTYTSGSTILINGPAAVVLDGGGNANAVWVFQIGSSLTTVVGSVSLIGGAQAKNVFWVPTADATIGTNTTFQGTILAGRDVTGKTGATINGRILAGAIGAATIALDSNTVNVPAP